MDVYNLGYVSTNIFKMWVLDNCGYRIFDDEISLILNRYDKDGDYRIKKDEFMSEVEGFVRLAT